MLALALDSWKENLKNEKLIEASLNEIFKEVTAMTYISELTNYNQNQLEILDSLIDTYQNSRNDFVGSYGFGRPEVRNLAWITSKENGIAASFEPALFRDLAEVYIELGRLDNILAYNRDFDLKADPDMSEYKKAQHIRKQFNLAIFRSRELVKKSSALLGKYKDYKYFPEELRE